MEGLDKIFRIEFSILFESHAGISSAKLLVISGIDIISEGMVTSVNDMVTEVTVQFVAQDVFNIEKVDHYSIGTIAEYETNVGALKAANKRQGRSSKLRAYKSDLYNKQSASRLRGSNPK